MKHTFFGHTFEKVTDEELNVLQVALVHLIEDLEDASDESLLPQYRVAKKLYLDLGGREFWNGKRNKWRNLKRDFIW